MGLIISGRGIVLDRDFKDAVTRKVARVGRLLPALIEARATFSAEKFRRTVRLTLTARHQVFSTAATDVDLMTAVDAAVARLDHQVRRAKDRRRLAPRPAHARGADAPGDRRGGLSPDGRPDHLRGHHRHQRRRQELRDQVLRGHGVLLRGQPAHHAHPHLRRPGRALDATDRSRRARRGRARGRVPRAPARHAPASCASAATPPRSCSWRRARRRWCAATTRRAGGTRWRGDGNVLDGIRAERKALVAPPRGRRPHRRHRRRSPCTSSRSCSSSIYVAPRAAAGPAHGLAGVVRLQARRSRSTPISCSTSASCPTRTSWRRCAPLDGRDGRVRDFVFKHAESRELLRRLEDFLGFVLPPYQREGKAYLTVAIGCTGGRHRSVALVEELARLPRPARLAPHVRPPGPGSRVA